MAKSTTGKWVSRVGASGGGKAYRKSRPSNYYGALAVIVALGVTSTVLARYDYQHPHTAKGTPPAVGTTWYAALSVEVCGKALPALAPSPSGLGGLRVLSNDVIQVSPTSAADAGAHATLAQFANEYPGLIVSSSELALPTSSGQATAKTTYRNGNLCPSGSKYAHQAGKVIFAYWTSFGQSKPTLTNNPGSIKFKQYLRVTMAFDPAGVTPKPPAQATVNAMVQAGATPTTTTVPTLTTTTTAGVTTTTTHAATTTTTPPG